MCSWTVRLLVLGLCAVAQCKELTAPRGEREATGASDESSLQTSVSDYLFTVCAQTLSAFIHDITVGQSNDRQLRYQGLPVDLSMGLPSSGSGLYNKPVPSKYQCSNY